MYFETVLVNPTFSEVDKGEDSTGTFIRCLNNDNQATKSKRFDHTDCRLVQHNVIC